MRKTITLLIAAMLLLLLTLTGCASENIIVPMFNATGTSAAAIQNEYLRVERSGMTTHVTVTVNADDSSYESIQEQILALTYSTGNPIFHSVNIDVSSGIFYSVYTFRASLNTQQYGGVQGAGPVKLTVTVNMPDKITQSKGGQADGNTIVFIFDDLQETKEIAAVSEVNRYGVVLAIIGVLFVIVVVFLFMIKRKK